MIENYFPELSPEQLSQFHQLAILYREWNSKINLISRKDIDHLEIRHLLFSLSIAAHFKFRPGTRIMDVGTGGGLPGIPLAICFPETEFTLVDSIGKKIRVVEDICSRLGLKNVKPVCARAEQITASFHFITGRAVTALPDLVRLLRPRISSKQLNEFRNGILYLKGGDLEQELSEIRGTIRIFPLPDLFQDAFFETKKLVYLSDL